MTVLMAIYRRWIVPERLRNLRLQVAFVRQMERAEMSKKPPAKGTKMGGGGRKC